jgi:hypothetical protein
MKPYPHRELEFLRSFIREAIIFEDSDYGMDPYSGGGGGGGGGDGSMFKLFVEPFLDVGKTVMGQSKELMVKFKSFAHVAFEAVVSSMIPFLSADYKKIFEKEKSDIQSIRSQYQSVYDRTNKAFKDSDLGITAALAFPEALFTAKFLKGAPSVVGEISSSLLGGRVNKGTLENLFFTPVKGINLSQLKSHSLREGRKGNDKKKNQEKMQKVIELRERVLRQALEQPEAQEMKSICLEALMGVPKASLEITKKYASINSIDDIYKILDETESGDGGKKTEIKKALDNLESHLKKNKVPQDKVNSNIQVTIKGAKKALISKALEGLESNFKKIKEFVPEDSEIVKIYVQTIQEIKQL